MVIKKKLRIIFLLVLSLKLSADGVEVPLEHFEKSSFYSDNFEKVAVLGDGDSNRRGFKCWLRRNKKLVVGTGLTSVGAAVLVGAYVKGRVKHGNDVEDIKKKQKENVVQGSEGVPKDNPVDPLEIDGDGSGNDTLNPEVVQVHQQVEITDEFAEHSINRELLEESAGGGSTVNLFDQGGEKDSEESGDEVEEAAHHNLSDQVNHHDLPADADVDVDLDSVLDKEPPRRVSWLRSFWGKRNALMYYEQEKIKACDSYEKEKEEIERQREVLTVQLETVDEITKIAVDREIRLLDGMKIKLFQNWRRKDCNLGKKIERYKSLLNK